MLQTSCNAPVSFSSTLKTEHQLGGVSSNSSEAAPMNHGRDSATSTMDALPLPLEISLEQLIDPIPTLLEQFPLPYMGKIVDAPLSVWSQRNRDAAEATNEPSCTPGVEFEDNSARCFQAGIQDLAFSGRFPHFLQRCAEEGCTVPKAALISRQPLPSSTSQGLLLGVHARGPLVSPSKNSTTEGTHRRPPSMSTVTQGEGREPSNDHSPSGNVSSWERNPQAGMSLRSRSRSSSQEDTRSKTVMHSTMASVPVVDHPTSSSGEPSLSSALPSVPKETVVQVLTEKPHLVSSATADTAMVKQPKPMKRIRKSMCSAPFSPILEVKAESVFVSLLAVSRPNDIGAEDLWRAAVRVFYEADPFVNVDMQAISSLLRALLVTIETNLKQENEAEQKKDIENDYLSVCRGILAACSMSHRSFRLTDSCSESVDHIVTGLSKLSLLLTHNISSSVSSTTHQVVPSSFSSSPSPETNEFHFRLRLFELLRFYFMSLARLVASPVLHVVSETNLHRLEEMVYFSLFGVATIQMDKPMYKKYCTYTLESAVRLYSLVWNHLESRRHSIRGEFFTRLRVTSENLLVQTCEVSGASEIHVMPFTMCLLEAMQSCPPLSSSTTACEEDEEGLGDGDYRWFIHQWSLWAEALVNALLGGSVKPSCQDKGESDARQQLLLQLLGEVASLVGLIEWPAADVLSRSVILYLARIFRSANTSSLSATSDELARVSTSILPFAVTAVHSLLRTFLSPPYTVLPLGNSAAMYSATMLRSASTELMDEIYFEQDCTEQQVQSKLWKDVMMSEGGSCTLEFRADAAVKVEEEEDSVGGAVLPNVVHRLEGLLYVHQRRALADASNQWSAIPVDTQAIKKAHLAANIAYWSWLEEDPSSGAKKPIQSNNNVKVLLNANDDSEASSIPQLSPDQLRRMVMLISAQRARGVLHESVRSLLISLLLSVLKNQGGMETVTKSRGSSVESAIPCGAMDSFTVTAVRKAIRFVAELVEQFPQLIDAVWPMLRKNLQLISNSRFREATVPLLYTLLSVSLMHNRASLLEISRTETPSHVLSSLLHLLEDENVSVVIKVVSVLESLLTNSSVSEALRCCGENNITLMESKLLILFEKRNIDLSAKEKILMEVTKLFAKRWIYALGDGYDAMSSGLPVVSAIAHEFMPLVELYSGPFPFEITSTHPLLLLLQNMWRLSKEAAASPNSSSRKKQSNMWLPTPQTLHAVMVSLSSVILSELQQASSKEEAVLCLSSLHLLAQVSSQVVEPCADCLIDYLLFPVNTSSPLYGDPERIGASFLQICLVLQCILKGTLSPSFSLEKIASRLTVLLSRYVGPYDQRVILASCGALTSLITCGVQPARVTMPNSPRYVEAYLRHCYRLMNEYYVRLKSLLPSLKSNQAHLSYAQRFLFLLSEFLRLYRGWKDPLPLALCGQKKKNEKSKEVPNVLSSEKGICENIYGLLDELEKAVPSTSAQMHSMVLRATGSLCMLDPNRYLYRCRARLAAALAPAALDLIHIQGLSIIRDFLRDEQERVEKAAGGPLCSALIAMESSLDKPNPSESEKSSQNQPTSTTRKRSGTDSESGEGGKKKRKGEARPTSNPSSAGPISLPCSWLEDQNSGMSTWLMDEFIEAVLKLTENASQPVRMLCLDILDRTAQGGLIPPVRYAHALFLLTGDVVPAVRAAALRCISDYARQEWREEVVLHALTTASMRMIDFQAAVGEYKDGASLLNGAYALDTSSKAISVFLCGYQLLSSKARQSFIDRVLRTFYVDEKMEAWCAVHPSHTWAVMEQKKNAESKTTRPTSEPVSALSYLAYMTVAVSLLSTSIVPSETSFFLRGCAAGMDLEGHTVIETLEAFIIKVEEEGMTELDPLLLYKALGILCLVWMSDYVHAEHELYSLRMNRGATKQQGRTTEERRGVGGAFALKSNSSKALIEKVYSFTRKLNPAMEACAGLSNMTLSEKRRSKHGWKTALDALTLLKKELKDSIGSLSNFTRLTMKRSHHKISCKTALSGKPAPKKTRPPPKKRVKRSPSLSPSQDSDSDAISSSSSTESSRSSTSSNSSS